MRRIVLLTTLAAMMAAAMALSGGAQAEPRGGSADAISPSAQRSDSDFDGVDIKWVLYFTDLLA